MKTNTTIKLFGKTPLNFPCLYLKIKITALTICLLVTGTLMSQDEIKRPKNPVKVPLVDNFVGQSFDLYDNMRTIRMALDNGQTLTVDQTDIIQYLSENGEQLIAQAAELIEHADKMSLLQQAKSLLQVGRATKALDHSLAEATNILLALNGASPSIPQDTTGTLMNPIVNESSNILLVNEDSGNEGLKKDKKGTYVTLFKTDYTSFKSLINLVESRGPISEKKIQDGTGIFFIAHNDSSYDIADLIVTHLSKSGFKIESVSDEALTVTITPK
ncbi:hypothetical protein [Mariniflexile sp. AS56]|uniref:hypothetical protein n=1 Tax=Mariniflexile sp. AS56 TaxID=3063957 RepID=UPI0026F1E770|nr:hypothetical protein [Mariniflexile sp. AS56]MDO7173867.1 hypothetical protein [Mariniflexile sp. AS56]